jgi:hypothetical protein
MSIKVLQACFDDPLSHGGSNLCEKSGPIVIQYIPMQSKPPIPRLRTYMPMSNPKLFLFA